MNLLLDTHIWLWWLDASPRLGKGVRSLISNPQNSIFISAISVWEITVKAQIGKLKIEGDVIATSRENDIEVFPFTPEHALAIRDLPLHHRDPFDRALLAQAKSERMVLVTSDRRLLDYRELVDLRLAED